MIPTAMPAHAPALNPPDSSAEEVADAAVAVGAGVEAGASAFAGPAKTAKTVKWPMVKVAMPLATVPVTVSHAPVASL